MAQGIVRCPGRDRDAGLETSGRPMMRAVVYAPEPEPTRSASTIDRVYREEYGRILATLIRLIRDVEIAEDVLQEAFAAALEQWRSEEPDNPAAWVLGTARHKAIDRLRRRAMEADHEPVLKDLEMDRSESPSPEDPLRLLFTCCHPALAQEAQIALTLRTLSGLSTEEIARAFLVSPATMAQRLVRAKSKIRDSGDSVRGAARRRPRGAPRAGDGRDLPRLQRRVRGDVRRRSPASRALRAGDSPRPDAPRDATRPVRGRARLLALMLLHDARRETRVDATGAFVRLEDQDRTRWDVGQIAEGAALVERALRAGPAGPYALQAAIAALHAQAPRAAETDWPPIAALYGLLYRVQPTPVVELNRAVAVAMADGPERGLALIDSIEARGDLEGYHWVASARADLLRRLGRTKDAAEAYGRALATATNEADRRFLEERLREVAAEGDG